MQVIQFLARQKVALQPVSFPSRYLLRGMLHAQDFNDAGAGQHSVENEVGVQPTYV
uniref:Uncharacterized protein n=1 Tax=Xanthomonas arboricola pv. pruni str. CFBP 5530 TaxID=1045865 RepID=G4U4Q6_9XANT|nr:hypothetical protein XAP_pXAP410021 [Xanthomonas arboricola pv. pruni str. CFBP 5530]